MVDSPPVPSLQFDILVNCLISGDFVRADVDEFLEDETKISTSISCRTIRIGSYKFDSKEKVRSALSRSTNQSNNKFAVSGCDYIKRNSDCCTINEVAEGLDTDQHPELRDCQSCCALQQAASHNLSVHKTFMCAIHC